MKLKHNIFMAALLLALVTSLAGCQTTEMPIEKVVIEMPSATEDMVEIEESQPIAENSTFEILFIDVGQADSALVSCDGHHMLIDGGNVADSSLLYAVMERNGIETLDLVVGTHGHEDHIGGIAGALNYATADVVLSPVTTYDSQAFENFKAYSGTLTIPEIGDQYALGSATVDILGLNAADDANNTSIILKITYGNTTFLFTGDAEYEAEQAVLNSGCDLSATVLKVGHHGSSTSTSYQFLNAIMPQYAVISCGADNSYGHPHDEVLSRLRDADVEVYRTDLQGDITCTSDGETVTFTTAKTATELNPTVEATEAVETADYYIGNINSNVFHLPTCHSLPAEQNQIIFQTKEEALAAGYRACGNCNP